MYMQKFSIFTQGCKINQYESQAIREAWLGRAGLAEAEDPEQADIYLINSCAVTDRAIQDLRKAVRRFNRLRPEARIIVTGCAAEIFEQQIRDLPGVTARVVQSRKPELCRLGPEPFVSPAAEQTVPEQDKPFSRTFPSLHISDYPRARPVLKIQDGCSQGCTYCIVPLTRGPARSRPSRDILHEAQSLLQSGYRELVISGINLAQYMDRSNGRMDFWDLIHWLDKQLKNEYHDGIRLRLSSLDPGLLSEKGLAVLRQAGLICPHLHLSIQSASPAVLRSMGRNHYTLEGLSDFIHQVKAFWPTFGLGADFLLGFPGETESDFQKTFDFCRAHPFSYAHIFPYSPRPGTRAAAYSKPVDERKKKQRSSRLRALMAEKRKTFLRSLLPVPEMHIVLEQTEPGLGLNEYYALCFVHGTNAELCSKEMVRGTPIGVDEQGLLVQAMGSKLEIGNVKLQESRVDPS